MDDYLIKCKVKYDVCCSNVEIFIAGVWQAGIKTSSSIVPRDWLDAVWNQAGSTELVHRMPRMGVTVPTCQVSIH